MSYVYYLCFFVSVLDLLSAYNVYEKPRPNSDSAIAYPADSDFRPSGLDLPNSAHHHHHYHQHPGTFHHTPEFHRNDVPPEKNSDDTIHYSDSDNEIPLDYIQNLNQHNISDLLLNFIDGGETPQLLNRFGEAEEERNAAIMAKSAGCLPEVKAVKIVENSDPSVLYIPQCTRIERCGGCCSHKLLSCQPSNIDTVTLQVIKTQYNGGKKLKYVGKELIQVEKHTKCKCDCIIQESDCNIYQEYRKNECRCTCKNFDEEKKCYKSNNTKLWDPSLCACICREVLSCSTGSRFDQNDCRCVPITMKRRYVKGYMLDDSTEDEN